MPRCGERKTLYTVDGNIKIMQHKGKQYGGFKKLNLGRPYDIATPFLGIQPKETKSQPHRDICTTAFIAIMFTMETTSLLTDEWSETM